jgi:hypothetical protein
MYRSQAAWNNADEFEPTPPARHDLRLSNEIARPTKSPSRSNVSVAL